MKNRKNERSIVETQYLRLMSCYENTVFEMFFGRHRHCISTILFICLFFTACNNFDELNTNPKEAEFANPDFLFTAATKQYVDWSSTLHQSQNVGVLAAQYFSQVGHPNESRYDWQSTPISENIWRKIYPALANFQDAKRILDATEFNPFLRDNKTACISVMETLAYQTLIDLFGNVPYRQEKALFPSYEDAALIYEDLIEHLDIAIRAFDISNPAFGDADLIYQGDILAWKKFANALKLRLGIRLSDINPQLARQTVESAVANTFSSNEDSARFPYQNKVGNSNPFQQVFEEEIPEYVLSNTLVDYMNASRDPRRRQYMTRDLLRDSKYVGKEYGSLENTNFQEFSQVNPELRTSNFAKQLMTFTEVAFILAEAAERGWNANGKASDWYNTAIVSSVLQWGGTATEAEDFLKNSSVAYGRAENGDNFKTIALQKWIALYPNGYQAWTEQRRLDYPIFNIPAGLNETDLPMRHTYPQSEVRLNPENHVEAVNILGGDLTSIRVFWDIK